MRYDIVSNPVGAVTYSEIILRGDTTINGIKFMKMWYRDWAEGEPKPRQWRTRDRYLGQENGKVYLWCNSPKEPFSELIMDISANAGDIVKVRDYHPDETVDYLVKSVSDTIIYNSGDRSIRRCLHLQGVRYNADEVWIEGIGSLKYGIEGDMLLWGGARATLVSCVEGGTVLYQQNDDILSIEKRLPTLPTSLQLFNLQGRRIKCPPRKGLYIQQGRKILLKKH